MKIKLEEKRMSIPLWCTICGDIVGVSDSDHPKIYLGCPGKGKHPKPERIERMKLWGIIKEVTKIYPETHTSSKWAEYLGPDNKFLLWLTMAVSGWDQMHVNGKWVWKRGWFGLLGR